MNAIPIELPKPRQVDAGRGVAWWTDAWALFMRHPGPWLLMSLVMIGILLVLQIVPLLGSLAATIIVPAFVGGWMLAARKVESEGTPTLDDLFSGFREARNPLLVIGALVLAATIVIGMVTGALGLGAVMAMVLGGARHGAAAAVAAAGTGLVALAVALVLGSLATVALWFAPALVVFRGMPPVDALKASLEASFRNLGPFLVYGLLYIVAAIVASVPFGLGWLVLTPLTLLGMYVSWRDIFDGVPSR